MHIIGIVGGVASGKSLVAEQLRELGAVVLEADVIGHEVLRGEEIKTAARRRWGDEIFGPDGRIDRRRLARIVFAPPPQGPKERKYLEELTHPEICRLIERRTRELAAEGRKMVVLDAPLLLEAGLDDFCNTIIYVDSPREIRMARARSRGWNEEDFAAREGAQDSLDSKRDKADVTIDNSGSPESTKAQIERWVHTLIV
ncbi:MAG: dephospho-CoA kinase [Pirellulales bacterium]|nr:dephospho-CoA kinase [Pirellulales bacterium]